MLTEGRGGSYPSVSGSSGRRGRLEPQGCRRVPEPEPAAERGQAQRARVRRAPPRPALLLLLRPSPRPAAQARASPAAFRPEPRAPHAPRGLPRSEALCEPAEQFRG